MQLNYSRRGVKMTIRYGTADQFLAVYSAGVADITSAEIQNVWTPYGALRVNEQLGRIFTTPFSSNNQTARDLSIKYAYLGILLRTRNQKDSEELNDELKLRIEGIIEGNSPMVLDDGESMFATGSSLTSAWSNTEDYNNTFDMRDAINQRVDPDLIDDLWDQDG